MPLKVNIIIGSTRPGRAGPGIAEWIREEAEAHGEFDVKVVDLASFDLPLLDEPKIPAMQQYEHEHTQAWSAAMDEADAFVFVTPEYNYFPPAAVVNAIQVLYREWGHKPAGVVSYGGISGGLRAAQGLRQLLGNVNAHALPQTVPVPLYWQHVNEDGRFVPTDEMRDGARQLFGELARWAVTLERMRSEAAEKRAEAA
jgi:NAD(P)H-dependent FMN reductase